MAWLTDVKEINFSNKSTDKNHFSNLLFHCFGFMAHSLNVLVYLHCFSERFPAAESSEKLTLRYLHSTKGK